MGPMGISRHFTNQLDGKRFHQDSLVKEIIAHGNFPFTYKPIDQKPTTKPPRELISRIYECETQGIR